MSVKADRVGNNAVVTITTDISGILTIAGISPAEKKQQVMAAVLAELQKAVNVLQLTDAQIDQQIADAANFAAAMKAGRMTGNL